MLRVCLFLDASQERLVNVVTGCCCCCVFGVMGIPCSPAWAWVISRQIVLQLFIHLCDAWKVLCVVATECFFTRAVCGVLRPNGSCCEVMLRRGGGELLDAQAAELEREVNLGALGGG